jgi:hypothetical protein
MAPRAYRARIAYQISVKFKLDENLGRHGLEIIAAGVPITPQGVLDRLREMLALLCNT